jgi:rhodanese-related sulfurtransferase
MRKPALSIDVSDLQQRETLATLEPDELVLALREPSVVVDVRSSGERADGTLRGSRHVPYERWVDDHDDARALLQRASEAGAHVIFFCMYSRERGPACARIAAARHPELRVFLVRGGFQQLMTQLWASDGEHAAELRTLFENVKPERWVRHGRQGLVWSSDLWPLALSESDPSYTYSRPSP